jgi:hypothetical protein
MRPVLLLLPVLLVAACGADQGDAPSGSLGEVRSAQSDCELVCAAPPRCGFPDSDVERCTESCTGRSDRDASFRERVGQCAGCMDADCNDECLTGCNVMVTSAAAGLGL